MVFGGIRNITGVPVPSSAAIIPIGTPAAGAFTVDELAAGTSEATRFRATLGKKARLGARFFSTAVLEFQPGASVGDQVARRVRGGFGVGSLALGGCGSGWDCGASAGSGSGTGRMATGFCFVVGCLAIVGLLASGLASV